MNCWEIHLSGACFWSSQIGFNTPPKVGGVQLGVEVFCSSAAPIDAYVHNGAACWIWIEFPFFYWGLSLAAVSCLSYCVIWICNSIVTLLFRVPLGVSCGSGHMSYLSYFRMCCKDFWWECEMLPLLPRFDFVDACQSRHFERDHSSRCMFAAHHVINFQQYRSSTATGKPYWNLASSHQKWIGDFGVWHTLLRNIQNVVEVWK